MLSIHLAATTVCFLYARLERGIIQVAGSLEMAVWDRPSFWSHVETSHKSLLLTHGDWRVNLSCHWIELVPEHG